MWQRPSSTARIGLPQHLQLQLKEPLALATALQECLPLSLLPLSLPWLSSWKAQQAPAVRSCSRMGSAAVMREVQRQEVQACHAPPNCCLLCLWAGPLTLSSCHGRVSRRQQQGEQCREQQQQQSKTLGRSCLPLCPLPATAQCRGASQAVAAALREGLQARAASQLALQLHQALARRGLRASPLLGLLECCCRGQRADLGPE